MAFDNIYKGKKVLVTGSTGFKGTWLCTWLTMLGADVYGYALGIPTQPSMFEVLDMENRMHQQFGDIRDREAFSAYVQQVRPDFLIHLAAQALVLTSYEEPFDTITTNVIGTTVVCESIRKITWDCTCILITSDKAYDNVEWIWGYRETDLAAKMSIPVPRVQRSLSSSPTGILSSKICRTSGLASPVQAM